MADQIYKVRDPSGALREISGPEGATDEQIIEQAKLLFGEKEQPSITPEMRQQAYREAAKDMPWLQRQAAAAFTPIAGGVEAVKSWFGKGDVEEQQRIAALQEEAPVGHVAGMLGTAYLAPTLAAKTALGRIGAATGAGAVGGLLTPTGKEQAEVSDVATKAAVGAGTGALAGGVIEGAMAGFRGLRNLIGPALSKAEANRAAGRLARAVAKNDADDIIKMIQSGQIDETAYQAAAKANAPEFQAVAKIVRDRLPKEYGAIEAGQEAARKARIAGVTPDLKSATSTRTAVTSPMYAQAKGAGDVVDTSPIAAKINEIARKNPGNPELLRELARVKGGLYDEAGQLRTNSEQIASVLDGLKTSMANKENKYILENLSSIKEELSSAIPGYQAAQKKFAELSAPVNQAQVLKEMQAVLEKPTGGERVTPFLNVLGRGEQAMLKKTTGFPRYESGDLSKVLTPEQLSAVQKTSGEMLRDIEVERLAKLGMPEARRMTGAFEKPIQPVGLLDRAATIINATIRRFEGKGGEKIEKSLAELMLPENKALLAKLMLEAKPSERELLFKAKAAILSGAASGQLSGAQ